MEYAFWDKIDSSEDLIKCIFLKLDCIGQTEEFPFYFDHLKELKDTFDINMLKCKLNQIDILEFYNSNNEI